MRPLFWVDVLKICRWKEKKKKNLLQLRKTCKQEKKKKTVYRRNRKCIAKRPTHYFM